MTTSPLRNAVLGAGLVGLFVLAACGSRTPVTVDETGAGTSLASIPLLPDGTVPWADLPATDEDFQIGATPMPSVDGGAGNCTADQLDATLSWEMKGDNDEGKPRTTANGLVGTVVAHNSGPDCTLQGEVHVTLTSNGSAVGVTNETRVVSSAAQQGTPVQSGGAAQMRLDWSAPFCGGDVPNQTLRIDLPQDGGALEAPAAAAMQPACTSSETHPDLTSVLWSQPFDIYRQPTPLDSVLNPVTLTYDAPAAVPADADELVLTVTLTNPTTAAIPFDPPPGYLCEVGTEGTVEAPRVSDRGLAFLNNRSITALPPGPTRFEMRCPFPDGVEAGQTIDVRWLLLHRALKPEGKTIYFQLPAT